MSTNYYARYNRCEPCGRYDQLHVGLSAVGWVFLWQGVDGDWHDAPDVIASTAGWRKFLATPGVELYDEYGTKQRLDEFLTFVSRKRGGKRHANLPYHPVERDPEGDDIGFYEFS